MDVINFIASYKYITTTQIKANQNQKWPGAGREILNMEMMSCDEYFMVGKCEGQRLVDGETIQLVRQPSAKGKNGIPSLLEAIGRNRDWFEEMIIKNSAVLLRGFDVKDGVEFNDVVEALAWDEIRYVGVSHRKQVHKRAWTANEGDLFEFIHYHHEMLSVSTS